MSRFRRRLVALAICGAMASAPGCAHRQLTNRQVAFGAIIGVAAVGLVLLAVTQCHKGAAYCDDDRPSP